MKKRVIIISISMVVLLIVVTLVSYIVTRNPNSKDNQAINTQENALEDSEEESETVNKSEFKDVNKDSQLANEIFNFIPKYLPNIVDKMSSEYIIYAAISKLEEEQVSTDNYLIEEEEIPGYKSDLVQKAAKEIYGNNTVIEKKDQYNLPIGYSKKDDAFFKYAMSIGSSEEFQVIKELKENDKTYKLTVYALSVEYDINDLTHIYISTKDTYKLYNSQEMDDSVIKKSMEEYILNGIELDPTSLANEFKNTLPLIEYELEKLDDRGTKYFVKDTKLIFD